MNSGSQHNNVKRNLYASILSYTASALSTFFLIPLINSYMGVEAYGYIGVALSFSSVASIVTISITPMITRFVSMSLTSGDRESANRYFNTSLIASAVLCAVIIGASIFVVVFIKSIMQVSVEFVGQIKILIFILAGSLCVSMLSVPFTAGLVYRDKLYILYIFLTASQLMRLALPYVLFHFCTPEIWVPYCGSLIVDCCGFAFYFLQRKENLPEVQFQLSAYDGAKLKEMLSSGIWASVSRAGNTFMGALNSYYANLILGTYLTGLYSSVAQIQSVGAVFATTVAGSFVPTLYRLYAKHNNREMNVYIKHSTKILGILLGLISGCLAAYVCPFVNLWLNIDSSQYEITLWLLVLAIPLTYSSEMLNQSFMAVNRLKYPAYATLGFGVLNIIFVVVFCSQFKFGLFGLVIAQAISLIGRSLFFTIPYASHILGEKKSTLYLSVMICMLVFALTTLVGILVSIFINPYSWAGLIFGGLICLIVSASLCVLLVLKKSERHEWFSRLMKGGKNG